MNKKSLYLILVVFLCAVFLYSIVNYSTDSKRDIIFGAVLHLTGDQAETAKAFQEGIELATDRINNIGGIDGRKIHLIIEDSKLQSKDAHNAAVKLIQIDKIVAAIDASFLEIMANGHLFNDAKIPVVTLWDSNASIENIGPYAFGIGIWTPSAGEVAANFSYHKLGARTAVVINIQNEWSKAVSGYFMDAFETQGGIVLDEFTLVPGSKDFRTVISKAKLSGAGVIYAPVTDGVVSFYEQVNQLGLDIPIVTSDIITGEHIYASPESFEGIYQTQAVDPSSDATLEMIELYRQKHGHKPEQVLFTAWGYDAVNLLAEAVSKVGTDGHEIQTYLHSQVQNYEGASGSITINQKGSSPKHEEMFRIKNGEFILER